MLPERNIYTQPVPIRNNFIAKPTLHTMKHLKFIGGFWEIHLLNILIGTADQKMVMGGNADITPSVEKHLKEL